MLTHCSSGARDFSATTGTPATLDRAYTWDSRQGVHLQNNQGAHSIAVQPQVVTSRLANPHTRAVSVSTIDTYAQLSTVITLSVSGACQVCRA